MVRDVVLGLAPVRVDAYEYATAFKWTFAQYVDYQPTAWTGPAYAAHGGDSPHPPTAGGRAGRLRPAGLPARAGAAAAGCCWPWSGWSSAVAAAARGARGRCFAALLRWGSGSSWCPTLTAEFVWRYQLPLLVLLPVAAALAWTRLRRRAQSTAPAPPPSTD